MSQATPAPWEGRYVPSGMPTGCVKFGVIGPDGLEIARVWRQEDVPVIAAAREAVDALKAWEALFEFGDFVIALATRRPITNGDQDKIDAVITQSKAAVTKAGG